MRKFYILSLLLLLLLASCGKGKTQSSRLSLTPSPGGNNVQPAPSTSEPTDKVILKSYLSRNQIERTAEKYGYQVINKIGDYYTLKVSPTQVKEAVSNLAYEPNILNVQPMPRLRAYTPPRPPAKLLDPAKVIPAKSPSWYPVEGPYGFYVARLGLGDVDNDGINETIPGQAWYEDEVSLQGALDYTKGSGATIAIISGGIKTDAAEFAGRLSDLSASFAYDSVSGTVTRNIGLANVDVTPNPDPTSNGDDISNTTALASVATAGADQLDVNGDLPPGTGMVGVAPDANIMVLKQEGIKKFYDGSPVQDFVDAYFLEMIDAIDYATQNGANVILFGNWIQLQEDPNNPGVPTVLQDAINQAVAAGALFVVGAGMGVDWTDPNNPIPTPQDCSTLVPQDAANIVVVGGSGTGTTDTCILSASGESIIKLDAPINQKLPAANYGNVVDFAAPSGAFITADVDPDPNDPATLIFRYVYYGYALNSEAGAAIVAGAAALLYSSIGSGATVNQITTLLTNTADTWADLGWTPDPAQPVGVGRLNINRAVHQANVVQGAGPPMSLRLIVSPPDPALATTNQPVSIQPEVANGTAPLSVTIKWGDGTPDTVEPAWDGTTAFQHTYILPGDYSARVEVMDVNLVTATSGVVFTVNNMISAQITFTIDPVDPLTVHFNAVVGNIIGVGVAQFLWDFGDGNTDTIQNPIHTFASAGSKNITLRVRDIRPMVQVSTILAL